MLDYFNPDLICDTVNFINTTVDYARTDGTKDCEREAECSLGFNATDNDLSQSHSFSATGNNLMNTAQEHSHGFTFSATDYDLSNNMNNAASVLDSMNCEDSTTFSADNDTDTTVLVDSFSQVDMDNTAQLGEPNAIPPNVTPPEHPTVTNSDQLSVFYTNADSLPNKLSELHQLINTMNCKPHIIAIVEVKPKNCRYQLTEAELQLPGYNTYTHNLDTKVGRGILIYVQHPLQASVCEADHTGSEQLWLSINLQNTDTLLFGCIYRSPASTVVNDNHLYASITSMCNRNHSHQLICGDFNTPGVDWDTWTAHGETAHVLVEALRDSYLYQHVTEPTRLRGTDNPSLLDLVLTNEELMISEISYLSPIGNSDHVVVTFQYHCYITPNRDKVLRYQFHKGNYYRMRRDLEQDWDVMFEDYQDDPDQQLRIVTEILHKSQEVNIPKRDVTKAATTRRTPLDAIIRHEIRRKHRLWERFMADRSEEKRLAYARQRNRVRKLTRTAKKQYESNLAEQAKENPKRFWRYAKSKLKTKEGVADLEETLADGTQTKSTTNEEKASTLSDYFSSVYTTYQRRRHLTSQALSAMERLPQRRSTSA